MAQKTYGIIGHPVRHSLSPAMQNAAFKALGIDAEYDLFDIEPKDLEKFLSGLAAKKISGVNVTIPHKVSAKDYIEKTGVLDVNARRLGAVNTVKVEEGALEGYNTDGPGFYRSLVADLSFEPEGRRVFVLGAGGAARAIIMYLACGPKSICVFDVDDTKAAALKAHYSAYYDEKKLCVAAKEDLRKSIGAAELLINATPIGMNESDPSPVDVKLLHPGLSVYDLVYNRKMTALVKEANALKLHAVTGLGMLLYQGAIAFEIWTGISAPIDVMKRALTQILIKQNLGMSTA